MKRVGVVVVVNDQAIDKSKRSGTQLRTPNQIGSLN